MCACIHTQKERARVKKRVLSLKWLQDWVATNWKSKAVELEGSREGTVEPPAPVVSQFRLWQKRPCSSCHHLTYSPVWNGSSCFFTVPHNGTKWLLLAKLQLAAKRPQRREKREKLSKRHWRREGGKVILSMILWELAPLHLSWHKHYSFFSCYNKELEKHWQRLQMAWAHTDCRSI